MTLYQRLQLTRSEEDVKDVYIKALNLKGYILISTLLFGEQKGYFMFFSG